MQHRKLRVIVGVILAESRDADNEPLDILFKKVFNVSFNDEEIMGKIKKNS